MTHRYLQLGNAGVTVKSIADVRIQNLKRNLKKNTLP